MILRDFTLSIAASSDDRRESQRDHRGLVYLFPPFSSPLKHFRSFDPE